MKELNICLIPDEKTQKICIDLSDKISQQFKTNFVLNTKDYIPHISIYHTGIPEKNENKLFNLVKDIANNTNSFQVKSTNFFQFDDFFFVNTNISDPLKKLHHEVVDTLNPLREGLLRDGVKHHIKQDDISPRRKKYAKEYGYYLVKEEFLPHITITNFISKEDIKLVMKSFSPPKFSFTADKIFIAEIGPFGTVPKIIKKFELNSK